MQSVDSSDGEPTHAVIENTGAKTFTRHSNSVWIKRPHEMFRSTSSEGYGRQAFSCVVAGPTWWEHFRSDNAIYTNATVESPGGEGNVSHIGPTYRPRYTDVDEAIASQLWLDSSWLLSNCWIEFLGTSQVLDRDAIQLRSVPVKGIEWIPWLSGECNVLLDRQYGIVLGIEVLGANIASARLEVLHVAIDEPIDDCIFDLEP